MPLETRAAFAPELTLPPLYSAVRLRELGDAFAHAQALAPKQGAGTLVYVGRFDLAEFALVLEPEDKLGEARRVPTRSPRPRRRRPPSTSSGRTRSTSTGDWSAAAGSPGRSERARTRCRRGWYSAA